jgi:hypothetical protein
MLFGEDLMLTEDKAAEVAATTQSPGGRKVEKENSVSDEETSFLSDQKFNKECRLSQKNFLSSRSPIGDSKAVL